MIHNKCIFFANNSIQKLLTYKSNMFLELKKCKQGIIILEFIFLFRYLNWAFLTFK